MHQTNSPVICGAVTPAVSFGRPVTVTHHYMVLEGVIITMRTRTATGENFSDNNAK